jgi:hypothetical protein
MNSAQRWSKLLLITQKGDKLPDAVIPERGVLMLHWQTRLMAVLASLASVAALAGTVRGW